MCVCVCVFMESPLNTSPCLYLLCNLACHLFSKVPVLTDSVEQFTTLHHLHDDQEPCSVKKEKAVAGNLKKRYSGNT